MIKYSILVVLCIVFCIESAEAQQNRNRKQQQSQQKGKVRSINELDSVLHLVEAYLSEKQEEDRLRELMEQAERLGNQTKDTKVNLNKKFHSGVRRQQGLNPNLSLGGDFFIIGSNADNESLNQPSHFSYGNNGMFLRELELGLESPLDPYTRGKSFISLTENGISIEEAYIEVLNLPLNMNLKLGLFNTEFGPLNRYHDHALPQFDRPRALVSYFGNGNFGGTGLSANFMLPRLLWADASSLEIAIIHGETPATFASGSPWLVQGVGHFKNYYDINDNSYFEFSLNSAVGKNPTGYELNEQFLTSVNSLGLTYKWVPAGRAKYRTFDWKSELFYVTYQEDQVLPAQVSKGFYSSIQNKLSARWWISGRIGYTEALRSPGEYQWDYTAALDFWQSEFVFFRLQYQYNNRVNWFVSNEQLPSDHTLLFQICWAMGPHKHEAY